MEYAPSSDGRSKKLERLIPVLDCLDADMIYGSWIKVLMGIYYESGGSEEGFSLANEWSSTGHQKYKDEKDVRNKWRSFKPNHPRPITIGSLVKMAKGKH